MNKERILKVAPFINTVGCQNYKDFISKPFDVNMLCQMDNVQIDTLFKNWHGKKMDIYYKFTNNDNISIEFTNENYIINNEYTLKLPITINDFINDMYRYNVQLIWTDWIDDKLEPKEYLDKDDIRKYFEDLLYIMEKSYELT